jgi:serine phosphatase RsbU (regulator of sigma subunit)
LVHPDDRPKLAERRPDRFERMADPAGTRREYRILTKWGDWVWIEENPTVIRDAQGRAVELVNVLRDIEDRKRAEAAAADIQAGMLLPRRALAALSDRVEVDAVLEPARNVGGDLFDAFLIGPDRLGFLLGDVTGKGVAASLFMALAKALSHSLITRMPDDLGAAFGAIEAELERSNGAAMALSLLAGVLDLTTGELSFCNAGCENPTVIGRDGTARELRLDGGPPLCAGAGFAYRADGVTEAQDKAGGLFGRPRFHAALAGAPREGPLPSVVDHLVAAVRAFEAGEEPSDDLAILAVRRPA